MPQAFTGLAVKNHSLKRGIRLAYLDEGKGEETLLFIHGLGSNLKGWGKNIGDLSKKFRCIVPDLPGYGWSDQGDYLYSMTFFAHVLHEFIAELGLEKVILVGHSMGAQIAIHMARQNDLPIHKLVLIAPAGFETFSANERRWISAVNRPSLIKALSENRIINNFKLNFFNMPDDARFMIDDRLRMRQTAAYDHFCNMTPQCVASMLDEPIFEYLTHLRRETLVLFGLQDALIPNRFLHGQKDPELIAKAGQRCIPNSRLVLLPNCGHFVQWECAQEVNTEIARFVPA